MAAYESIYGAVSVRLRHGTLYNDLIILSEIKIDVKYFFDILEKKRGAALGVCCPLTVDESSARIRNEE